MKVYRKNVSDRTESQICNEVDLQTLAYNSLKCTAKIIETDYKTYIDMEDLNEMCIADMYGEDIKNIPTYILTQIHDIIVKLYLQCGIEYVDVTPYNFIEINKKVYIIDFGDAQRVKSRNWYLQELFSNTKLHEWNPDFK